MDPPPKTFKQVRSFLGLASYFCRFFENLSKIAKPLTNLLHKGVKFEWTNKCQESFQAFKAKLTSPPVLTPPDTQKDFDAKQPIVWSQKRLPDYLAYRAFSRPPAE